MRKENLVFERMLLYNLSEFVVRNKMYQFTYQLIGPNKFEKLKHGYKNALVSLKFNIICVHYNLPYTLNTLSLKSDNGVYAFFKKPNSNYFTKNQRDILKEGNNYINVYGLKFNIYTNQFNLPKSFIWVGDEVASYSKMFIPLNYNSVGLRITMKKENEAFEEFIMKICRIALMRQNLLYYEPDEVKIKALNSLVNELAHYYREDGFEVNNEKLAEIKKFVI